MPRTYGPELSERERTVQKTKQYPHMFPPEGTFMYWFLTNRNIHAWIVMVGLSVARDEVELLNFNV